MNVAALFIDPKGIYPELLGRVNCYCNEPGISIGIRYTDDACDYRGLDPVVAHPPCHLWVNMAAVNWKRATAPCEACSGSGWDSVWDAEVTCNTCNFTGRREPNRTPVKPAWYPGGSDGGCFASALASVRRWGGVLEHPAESHAWEAYGLHRPEKPGWNAPAYIVDDGDTDPAGWRHYWTCEVWQSAYGHAARKRTWLLYCGKRPPFELRWDRNPGTHQVGWFDRNKPTLSKRAASATPRAFAEELIRLAEWSRG